MLSKVLTNTILSLESLKVMFTLPYRCFELFWLMGNLLMLKIGYAKNYIRFDNIYNKNNKGLICPTLTGVTRATGEFPVHV